MSQRRTAVTIVTFLMCFVVISTAESAAPMQEPAPAAPPQSDSVKEVGNSYTDSTGGSASARPQFSSVPKFLQNMRNSVGFSVGVNGSYDPSATIQTSDQKEEVPRSLWLTPRLFANVRGRRTQTFLDYSFASRTDSRGGQLSGSSHTISARVDRALSTKLSLAFDESFTSSTNDRRTFLQPVAVDSYRQTVVQDLDVSAQRVTRNSFYTTLNYQINRRNSFGVLGGYDFWRYGSSDFGNTHGFLVGLHSSHKLSKWLSLENSYSHYLNVSANALVGNNGQIHSLQVGGLRLAGSRTGWALTVSGGADISSRSGEVRGVPSVQTSLSKNSESGQFALVYRRGLWTAVGQGGSLEGDSVSATYSQSLKRLSLTVGASYRRGTGTKESAVDFASGNAQLGFAVQSHLMLTAEYWYVSQRVANVAIDLNNVHRYRVGAGINYFLPSLFGRSRGVPPVIH